MALNKGLLAALIVIVIVAVGYMALRQGMYETPTTPTGGYEYEEPTETTEATMMEETGGETVTVKVELYEWGIEMSSREVKPGVKVVFEVVNKGSYTHALEIENKDLGFEAKTRSLRPGETAKLEVTFKEPGEYEVYCPIGNHRGLGMDDMLIVKS
ncbi:MAG: cupredoxin domain-containing protein [Desulfurococcales archaeon]|nr:cupredoxin domain-containing protein [Desulfurococcales archaeon]